jgi:hypothetical protein
MSDQRWAARYTFCDALWRGRARVVADPELEALLVESDRQGALGDAAPPVLELVDALLPRERGVPVWMIVGSDEIARRLAPSRPGVRFVAATAAADVFARHPWEVALVALRTSTDEMFTDVGGYAVTTIDEGPGRAFGRHAAGWMSAIADAVGLGRSAVLAVDADDAAYDALVESAAAYFSAARIYAMYAPAMLAFVELDDAQEEDDDGNGLDAHDISAVPTYNRIEGAPADRWDVDDGGEAEADDEDDEDAVPLSFDNTLGAAEPRFLGYLAIASGDEAPDGLTLVEVTGSVGGDDDQDNGSWRRRAVRPTSSRSSASDWSSTSTRWRPTTRRCARPSPSCATNSRARWSPTAASASTKRSRASNRCAGASPRWSASSKRCACVRWPSSRPTWPPPAPGSSRSPMQRGRRPIAWPRTPIPKPSPTPCRTGPGASAPTTPADSRPCGPPPPGARRPCAPSRAWCVASTVGRSGRSICAASSRPCAGGCADDDLPACGGRH